LPQRTAASDKQVEDKRIEGTTVMPKQPKKWMYSPAKPTKAAIPAAIKAELETKAKQLIEQVLKPKHVLPPPTDAQFNYITDIATKWHGSSFFLVSTYACPGPNALSPTFESKFARMEHVGGGRFNLSFMRHTGKWVELFTGQTVDECLHSIRDDPWFVP
jgi:hypothetical protein